MPRILKEKSPTYISLFSCAGIGCLGFLRAGYKCIATNELISRRLDIQRYNHKCERDEGYIQGDITTPEVKHKIFDEINWWKQHKKITDVDVVIATPPCQGMSIFNHKKNEKDIVRNSLVIESLTLVKEIQPKFFVFENVPAFMDTACIIGDSDICSIREAHERILGNDYLFYADIINFKLYGSNSSRMRTLVIGVRKNLVQFVSPVELFPARSSEQTLRQVIGDLPSLHNMGEICEDDIYHAFREYPEYMRPWISDLCEGQSAFDNTDPLKRPYKLDKNGNMIENANKTRDKYKRQIWDKCGLSVHTRNDQLASQNTIHPSDDRVFSIRELMRLMTIPDSFCWTNIPYEVLNNYSTKEKKKFLKREETNIRQCIGEAVPTIIFEQIANNILDFLNTKHYTDSYIKRIIKKYSLNIAENLSGYIDKRGRINEGAKDLSVTTLARIAELANNTRVEKAAYYTGKDTLTEVFQHLPTIDKSCIRILEPAVGAGNFIPFLIKKYAYAETLIIDVIDIDDSALAIFRKLNSLQTIPENTVINVIKDDFIIRNMPEQRYDLIIGNPPYLKLSSKNPILKEYQGIVDNSEANNLAAFFIDKAIEFADYVAFVLPKNFLCNIEYQKTRKRVSKKNINAIIDFGEFGFRGVNIETIFMIINTQRKAGNTFIKSLPHNLKLLQKQRYITDKNLPNWVLYRNELFDYVLNSKKFDVFDVFRDRQIQKESATKESGIWVVKSRNIPREGGRLEHYDEYDMYVTEEILTNKEVYRYLMRDDVYLVPNMTYYPRMVKKPAGVITNGSVAILIPKPDVQVSESDIKYIASDEFEQFYRIARNHATRSLNVDNVSVYYFCVENNQNHQ